MSKDSQIRIEGGCCYDYERHVVVHNNGPMSDNTCVHAKEQDESALADNVRSAYAQEILLATSEEQPQEKTFISEEKVLQRFKELLLEELDDPGPRLEIRKFEWPVAEDSVTGADVLHFLEYEPKYNCCMYKKRYILSQDFLIRIPNDGHADAFDSILVPCVDPQRDIESVTLFAETVLPKDKQHSLGSDYVFQESLCRKVLVPIKTLSCFETNRISFASHPIILYPYFHFCIHVKYKSKFERLQQLFSKGFVIEVEHLHFASNVRDKVVDSAWQSLTNEPGYAPSVFLE